MKQQTWHPPTETSQTTPPWQHNGTPGGPWQDEPAGRPRGGARKRVPTHGWQRLMYLLTGHLWNPGLSPADQQWLAWLDTIDTPVHTHRVTTSSKKGGASKTTTAVAVGTVCAMYRRDMATIIDANPDEGNAAERVGPEHTLTVRDLLDAAERGEIDGANAFRRYTHQADSRLEVLASDQDPAKARAFSPQDYTLVQQIMETFRQILITDTGIDLTQPVVSSIMDSTDSLIVPAFTSRDSANKAWTTLNTWETRVSNGPELVRNAVVPITQAVEGKQMPVDELREWFEQRVRAVVYIPHDKHLAGGGVFDWEQLHPATRRAFVRTAATVAEAFPKTAHSWTQ